MRTISLLPALAALWLGASASAAELVTVPGGEIHVNAVNPGEGQLDAVVHAIGVLNDGAGPLTIEEITIDVMVGGHAILTKRIGADITERHSGLIAGMMARDGGGSFVGGMLSNEDGVEGLFGEGTMLDPEGAIDAGAARLLVRQFLAFDQVPDTFRVSARVVHDDGHTELLTREITVAGPDTVPTYAMPLEGGWFVRSEPNVGSHHRFVPATEFAYDFFKTDSEGRIFEGERTDPSSFFGFGAPVLAVAPGEVTLVINDSVEDLSFRVPREGESREEFQARISQHYGQDVADDALRGVAGNIVVVRQDDGNYMSYGHLAESSVLVEVGERVETGQPLAAVGGTGEGGVVHLHIQMNAGPHPLFDAGLPFRFEGQPRDADTGRFARSPNP